MRAFPSVLVIPFAALVLAGCGPGGSAGGCAGNVCKIEADGPASFDLDAVNAEAEVSQLAAGSVRVTVGGKSATVRQGQPQRVGGLLVTASKASKDHATVRFER
ncbi:hypothetical protein [Patulibacter americanus]|uniref:hypothetical protein n=1 Tax=Patulibacter americanus TaxID=588672 RepID=UPI0003B44941|nr:hypothetical protein [Patulibacter americanus]